MNSTSAHSFVRLRTAMRNLATWLDAWQASAAAHAMPPIADLPSTPHPDGRHAGTHHSDAPHRHATSRATPHGKAPHPAATPYFLHALCARGLRNIADHAEEFDKLIARPNPFAAHFAATVAMLAPTAARLSAAAPPHSGESGVGKTGPGIASSPSGQYPVSYDALLADSAFMLLEDMATFFRERSLRAPDVPLRQAEAALLAHFEQCGEWLPADGTQVADWYYVRLPALVLTQLLRKAGEVTPETPRTKSHKRKTC